MPKKVNLLILIYFITIILTLCMIGAIFYIEFNDTNLNFYIFDVGQGDSILIKTPSHEYILIDGGPDNSVIYKLGKFLPFYQRQLDYVILTHADADHLAGLVEVLNRYQVKNVITTSFVHKSSYFQQWQNKLSATNILIVDQPKLLSFGEVKLYFIHPSTSELEEDPNNASIVFKLVYKDVSALFVGDYENEESLINKFDLKADFLKVGHHGATNANDHKFLKKVSPSLAAISVGQDNKFGHPRPETLLGLENLGVTIFRTDILGDLHFVSRGQSFEYLP